MARLAFCDYHNMIAILEKYEHNTDFHQIVDFVEAYHLRRNLKLRDEAGISSLPDVELFENLTQMGYNILPNQKFTFQKEMIFDGMVQNVNNKVSKFLMYPSLSFSGKTIPLFPSMLAIMGEGSGTPTEPHHTPTPEATPSPQHELSSSSLPPPITETIPTVIPTDNPPSLLDDSQGEVCPTVSSLEAEQDRANIIKTSTLPSDSTPKVTSLAADEGSMHQQLNELTNLYTRLQRQQIEMASKGEALIERSTKRGSDDTEEMVTLLTSMDAASILTSGVSVSISPITKVPTGSGSIPIASPLGTGVPTSSGMVPTTSPIFTTATESTPYTRRKGKEKMVESDTPKKKKLQEQINIQVAREMEEQMVREDQRRNEQIERDAKIARIHIEEELQMMIDGLDRNNKTVAKYLQKYHQFAAELPIRRRIELISDLVKYQDHYVKVLKFQTQQRKP
nr:hypothetical protein [Tanacetum cinerariifolium]